MIQELGKEGLVTNVIGGRRSDEVGSYVIVMDLQIDLGTMDKEVVAVVSVFTKFGKKD